jgi:hypothetical protein
MLDENSPRVDIDYASRLSAFCHEGREETSLNHLPTFGLSWIAVIPAFSSTLPTGRKKKSARDISWVENLISSISDEISKHTYVSSDVLLFSKNFLVDVKSLAEDFREFLDLFGIGFPTPKSAPELST